jgi:hypothetical protein
LDTNITGNFCYAPKFDDYEANCRSKAPNATWIVANQFEIQESNYMIKNATNETLMIRGLIFISD